MSLTQQFTHPPSNFGDSPLTVDVLGDCNPSLPPPPPPRMPLSMPENSRLVHRVAAAVPAVPLPTQPIPSLQHLLPHASEGTHTTLKQIASPISPHLAHHFTLPSPSHRVPPLPLVNSGTCDITTALFPGQHLYSNTSPFQRNNIALPTHSYPLHLPPAPTVFPYSPVVGTDPHHPSATTSGESSSAAAQLDLTIAQLEQSVQSLQQQLFQGHPTPTHPPSVSPSPSYSVSESDPGVKSPLTSHSLDTANSTLGSQVVTPALLVTPSPPPVSVRSSQSTNPSSRSSVTLSSSSKMNHSSSDLCSTSGSEGSSSPESLNRHHTHHHHPAHQQANMRQQHVRLTPQQKEAAMLEQAREREAEEQDEDEDDEECEDGHEGLSDSKMKRGHGSSCHQCKTTKEPKYLFFCTNKAEKGVRKRRCRKKYCDSCLNRSYGNHASEVIPSWQCPSCLGLCICAACHRKTTLRKNGGGSVTSGPSAAATAAAANHHQEAIRLAGLAEKRNQANAATNGESYSPLSMPSKTRTLSHPSSANLSPLTISRSLSGSPRFHSRSSLGKGNSSHSNSSSSLVGMDSEHEGSMDPHSFQITEEMEKVMVGMDHHQRASYLAEVSGKNSNSNSNRNSPRGSPRSVKRKIRGSNPSTDMGSPTQQVKLHMKQRLNSKLHSENGSMSEVPPHVGLPLSLPPSHAASYAQGNRRSQQLPNIGLDMTSPNPSYGYLQSPSMMPHSSQHLYPLSIPSSATQLPDEGLVDGGMNSNHSGLFSPMTSGVFSPGPPPMDHTQMYENQYYQLHHQHPMPPVVPNHHSHHHHHHQPQLHSPNPALSTTHVNVTQSSSRQQVPPQATMPVKSERMMAPAAGMVSPAIPPEPVAHARLEVPHQRQNSSNSLIPPPLTAPVKLEWGTAQQSMPAPMASPNPLLSPLPEASTLYTYQTTSHSASQQASNMAMSFFSSPTSMSTQTPSTTSSLGYPSSANGALFSPNPTASPSASHAGHALVYPSTYLPEATDETNFTFRQLSIGGQNCVMSETPNGAGLFAGGRLVSAASAGWGAFGGSRGVSAVDHDKDLHLLLNPDITGSQMNAQGIHLLPPQPSLIGR